ncbi:MAG: LexA family transcriptional regulator, partial [Clostridia bacterium]
MDIGKRIKKLREEKNLTQEQLAKSIDSTKQSIFKYENRVVTNIPMDKLTTIAKVLGCSPAYLMGWESCNSNVDLSNYNNISHISVQRIPMIGKIACGKPIFCNEEHESYVSIGTNIEADFCLTACGDSMIGARIQDGDIVFIKNQEM